MCNKGEGVVNELEGTDRMAHLDAGCTLASTLYAIFTQVFPCKFFPDDCS